MDEWIAATLWIIFDIKLSILVEYSPTIVLINDESMIKKVGASESSIRSNIFDVLKYVHLYTL